jgi:phosphatidylglycerophosphate synthase
MPSATSSRESAPDLRDTRSLGKKEDRFSIPGLGINRFLNRPLAGLLVRLLYPTRVTPNQVTVAAFLVGLGGAAFFFSGRPWAFMLGGILAQLSSIVDCADGMLARARGQESAYGAALDLLLDRINEYFLLTGMALGYYRFSGRSGLLVLGLLGTAAYFLQTTIFYLMSNHGGRAQKGEIAEDRGWLIFVIFLFGVTRRIDLATYVLPPLAFVAMLILLVDFHRTRGRAGAGRPGA